MADWIRLLRGALTFDTETYAGLARRRDAMLIGAVLIVAVALIAALPAFIIDIGRGIRSRPLEPAEANATIQQALGLMQPYLQNMPPEVADSITGWVQSSGEMAQRIDALPTSLPKPVGAVLKALGSWLSKPFGGNLPLAAASLATWLGYGIWVALAAKLLGGRGDLASFFGATALFAAPHLLGVFALVPFLGPLIGLVAFFWGLAIYVKATSVSQELSLERSLLAVLLPGIVAIVLLLILGFGLVGLLVSAISASR